MTTEEKIKERTTLEQNLNAINQRIQQFQSELQNLNNQRANTTAQIIRLEGWFEGAGIDYTAERDKIDGEKTSQKTLKGNTESRKRTK